MTKFKMMTASIIAVATLAAAVPAAADAYGRQTKLVSTNGIDLSTAKGQEKLQKRIKYAVRSVCGYHQARSLTEIANAHKCMSVSQANADGKVQISIARHKQNRQLAAREIVVGN